MRVKARIPPGNEARNETEPCLAKKTRSKNCISVNDAIEMMMGAATRHTSRYPPGLGGVRFHMVSLQKITVLP